jgi:predicted DCC family thiol-disulfide oxidoreductase YuxK
MNSTLHPDQYTFFYDGECRFCRSLAFHLKKRNQSPNLVFYSFRDFHENELLGLHPGLTEEVLESEVQLVYKNTRYPGFFAVRKILFNIKIYKFVTPILYLPFVPFLGMFVMYLLKRYRNLESTE